MRKLLCVLMLFMLSRNYGQELLGIQHLNSPLPLVLQDIESKTGVIFSFSDAVVKNIFVTIEENTISLTEALTIISEQTGLLLERVSDKQIIVRKRFTKISVCGYLVDEVSGESLPNATVLVDQTAIGTITNEVGYFKLEQVAPDAVLRFQYIGYSDQLVKADQLSDGSCKNISLKPETQTLDEVVVLGYIAKGVNKNADGSFTMLKEGMGVFPGLVEPDIFESIQFVPGITSLDETASGIQIRGGSPDQNLIFFDGIKMYNTGHFFGMISAFNPYVIQSAKIFKGGASPEYGDRISGVIDMSSGDKIPKNLSGGFGVNGTHGDLFLRAPLGEKLGILVSARRSYTDLLKTPTFDALSQKVFQNTTLAANSQGIIFDDEDDDDTASLLGKEDFFFYDANVKILLQPTPNDNITVSGLLTKNDLDFRVSDDEDVISDQFLIENKGASFAWRGGNGRKWHYGLKGYYSLFESIFENALSEDDELEEQILRQNSVQDFGVDAQVAYDFLTNHTIRLGYQYSRTDVFFSIFFDDDPLDDDDDAFGSRNFNVNREGINSAHSAYTEYTYRFGNKGFLSAGARVSDYSFTDTYFVEPRLNVEFPLDRHIRVKGTFEKRYQPISQLVEFEDVQVRLENNIWTLSNGEDIPLLESTQYSGGILFNLDGWILDVDGYRKNISGLTSFTNGFTTAANNLSAGESDIWGIDVLLRKKVYDFNFWLGYTFNDVVYTFPQLQNNPFPGNNDITHNLRFSSTFEKDNWLFSLGWSYRTGAPFTLAQGFNPGTNFINFGAINSERLPDYHRMDASVMYRFPLSTSGFRGEIGASFKNIYNRQQPISIFYRLNRNLNNGETELDQIRQLSLGFTPNFQLRFYF